MSEDERLGDPKGLIRENIDIYTAAIGKFAHEAEHGDNASARIGATRSMLDAMDRRTALYIAVGLVPRSPTAEAEVANLQEMVEGLAEVLRRYHLPQEAIAELRAVVERHDPKRTAPQIEPPRATA
jgi:hypothetical protein